MILRLGSGWQTVTADLALILFMVTAQAIQEPATAPNPATTSQLVKRSGESPAAPSETGVDLASGASLAIFRPGPGVDLTDWLEATLTDERQEPTVYVRYRPGGRDAASKQGSQLVGEIEQAGRSARLVIEPGSVAGAMVVVAFSGRDADGTLVAGRD